MKWSSALDVAELASASRDGLRTITSSRICRNLARPVSENLITIGVTPSTSALEGDCTSHHLADIWAHGGSNMQRAVAGHHTPTNPMAIGVLLANLDRLPNYFESAL